MISTGGGSIVIATRTVVPSVFQAHLPKRAIKPAQTSVTSPIADCHEC